MQLRAANASGGGAEQGGGGEGEGRHREEEVEEQVESVREQCEFYEKFGGEFYAAVIDEQKRQET